MCDIPRGVRTPLSPPCPGAAIRATRASTRGSDPVPTSPGESPPPSPSGPFLSRRGRSTAAAQEKSLRGKHQVPDQAEQDEREGAPAQPCRQVRAQDLHPQGEG